MTPAYFELKDSAQTEYEIKKSVFIARAHAVTSREQAMAKVEQARQDYPDARHHCWAYLLGSPHKPENAAMSDDGEPSGTAGKPIYNVIQHKEVGNIIVIVIRYFGGIKLGAGGLVRAYSQATNLVYEALDLIPHVELRTALIRCDFPHEQQIRHLLNQYNGKIDSCHYGADIQMRISLPASHVDMLSHQISLMKGPSIIFEG